MLSAGLVIAAAKIPYKVAINNISQGLILPLFFITLYGT